MFEHAILRVESMERSNLIDKQLKQSEENQLQQNQEIEESITTTNSNYKSSTAQSPFNFIHCHSCRRDFKNNIEPQFYLTSCSHLFLCSYCLNLKSQIPNSNSNLIINCPICNTRGQIVLLETSLQSTGMEGVSPFISFLSNSSSLLTLPSFSASTLF